MTHTVEELLWGYDDPLLKFLYCFLPSFIPSYRFGLEVSIARSCIVKAVSNAWNLGDLVKCPE